MGEVEGEHILKLAGDASVLLQAWETEIETVLGDGGAMEFIRDWGAKLAGATLRLAAVLHCMEHGPEGRIGATTLAAAITIARYLIPHAEAVLSRMQAQEGSADADARYVLKWIERRGRSEFTKSEAQHHGKRRFPKADDIDPAIEELTKRGFVRLRPAATTGPGRPPSPIFEVNPAVFANKSPDKCSHNSQNSAEQLQNGDSGNIGSASGQSDDEDREQVTI
jgi:hypothetical protein